MRLISFSVTNFRSITTAHKIPIGDSTVLIGKNNEGKSNFLRALNISMRALASQGESSTFINMTEGRLYSWERDFPISLQGRRQSTDSIFRLEFLLNASEINEFKREIRSDLNGALPIEIRFGKSNTPQIHVPKRGRGGNSLSAKSKRISTYIASRIQFNYIPAVRTEEEALNVVQEMLSRELVILEHEPAYIDALRKISELQQPILDRVSKSIKSSLKEFLPNIKNVSVKIPLSVRRTALRSQCSVEVDDGTKTLLEYKGDGVKSLAALGLLKDKRKISGASLIAIEEPESHLHPGAMHGLREVIDSLAKDNQVVITTHCPLFVDRNILSRNILIDSRSAIPSKNISSIREILGIRASDNLINANFVLVVEGNEDKKILNSLLFFLSPTIVGKAMKQNMLVIDPIRGSGNLPYKLSLLTNELCKYHVFLDHDDAGRLAYKNAEKDGLLKLNNVNFSVCNGKPNSELEDCFDSAIYRNEIFDEFGVNLVCKEFKTNKKWSDKLKDCFLSQGKTWDDDVESRVKYMVANLVSQNPAGALANEHLRGSIYSLANQLELMLSGKQIAV